MKHRYLKPIGLAIVAGMKGPTGETRGKSSKAKLRFARTLRQIVSHTRLSRPQIAERAGIDQKRLSHAKRSGEIDIADIFQLVDVLQERCATDRMLCALLRRLILDFDDIAPSITLIGLWN